jgi:hypothetical protein
MPTYEIISDDIRHTIECSSMEIDNGVLILYETDIDETVDDCIRAMASPSIKQAFKLWERVEKV